MTSTEIWIKFKKENKELIGENNITIDKFKDIITGFINSSTYTEKTKKSVIEFIGFTWKQIEVKSLENLQIENIVIEKVKKVKKEKSIDTYFDFEKDKKILKEYENLDSNIMEISELNGVRPWQVVSLLMRYKVITKRDDARGYNKYKETEEYKNKLFNK